MFWMNDQEYILFQGCCIWWITFMAFSLETQRSNGGVRNDITIVYLSWKRKSCVVEKWTSKIKFKSIFFWRSFIVKFIQEVTHHLCVFKWRFIWKKNYASIRGLCCESLKNILWLEIRKSNMVLKNRYLLSRTWND